MNLEAAAVTRLRDYLLHDHRTADVSQVSSPATVEAILRRIRPFAEIMYLVMATDEDVDAAELKTLQSALEVLCDNIVPPAQLESLLNEFRQGSGNEEEGRIQMAAALIGGEKQDREMAFLLAAAIAVADHRLEEVERTTMQWVREYLGISDRRMNELLTENLV